MVSKFETVTVKTCVEVSNDSSAAMAWHRQVANRGWRVPTTTSLGLQERILAFWFMFGGPIARTMAFEVTLSPGVGLSFLY